MADGPEVGTAYVSLVPSAKGFGAAVGKQIGAPVDQAAGAAGSSAGSKLSGGLLQSTVGTGGQLVKNLGFIAAGGFALNAAKNVEDANNIIVRTTGASGKALDGLQSSFKNIASTSSAGFDVISQTMSELFQRTGLTGTALETLTKQVVSFNRIMPDAPIAVQDLTQTLAGFNIPAQDMSATLDKLFVTSQKTGVPLAELVGTLESAGPVIRQFGFPIEQAAGLLAQLNKAGVDGSTVMSGLRTAMVKFAKDGKDPADALKQVVGQIQQLIKTGDIVGARDLAVTLFGARGTGLVDAVVQGKLSLDSLTASFDATGKGILETSSDTATLSGKLGVMRNNLSLIGASLAAPLLGSFTDATAAALPLVQQFSTVLAGLPGPLQAVLGGGIALGSVAGPLSNMRQAFAGVGSVLPLLITGFTSLGAAMITILPFVAIAAAIAVAAFLIVKNWDTISEFFANLWDGIASGATTAWDSVVDTVTGAGSKISGFVTGVWSGITSTVTGVFNGIANFLGRWWKVILLGIFTQGLTVIVALVVRNWDKVKTVTLTVFNSIVTFLAGLPARIISIFQSIYQGTVAVFSALVSFIAGVPGQIIGFLSTLISAVPAIFSAAWQGAIDVTLSIGGAIISFVAGIPGQILGALSGLGSILFDAGSSIISGLLSGIQSAVGSVYDFVRGIPGGIIDIIKGGIGFGSPARKFIPLGLSIPQGLAIGMLSGKPIVESAAARMLPSGAVTAPAFRAFTAGDRSAALQGGAQGLVVQGPLVALNGPVSIRDDSDITKLSRRINRDSSRALRARGHLAPLNP